MSVARTARRKRIKMINDRRYRKRSPEASARKLARQIERQKLMNARKK